MASFITTVDGLISEITEVWTDVHQTPPPGSRPS